MQLRFFFLILEELNLQSLLAENLHAGLKKEDESQWVRLEASDCLLTGPAPANSRKMMT